MSAKTTSNPFAPGRRCEIGFVAASIIWAAVMVDTGAVAWPLAMWVTTALVPLSLYRSRDQADQQDRLPEAPA